MTHHTESDDFEGNVEVIAEAGVNHNGSEEMAFRLVDAAVDAGADVIKFQTFSAAALAAETAPLAAYQKKTTENTCSQRQMLQQLELPLEVFRELHSYCNKREIEFMSSPFDADSLRFLVDVLGVKRLKIASGEITNGPLLLEFANSGCSLILSTGMSNNNEIQQALSVLAFALVFPGKQPSSINDCLETYNTAEARALLQKKVTLLHCTSQYPAPIEQINLAAMPSMASRWSLPTGYSDHSEGIVVAIAAAALGAPIIEKHFTLDQNLPGPDHRASLEPKQLAELIKAVRLAALSVGSSDKQAQACELDTAKVARKSLFASRDIKSGECFTASNVKIQRPASGISPMEYWQLLTRSANRGYRKGDPLNE